MFKHFIVAALAVSLTTCGHAPTRMDSELVHVSDILGALKCAFATALVKENQSGNIPSLAEQVAYGTLTLNVVYKRSAEFGIKGKAVEGGPFVFSYLGGTGSILPSFSASSEETNTIKTDINFRYYLSATDSEVCGNVDAKTQARYGFTEWLASIISGLDKNAYQYPLGSTDSVVYDAQFGVLKKGKAGVDFDVVFLSGNLGRASERNDVQSIKFTIATPTTEQPAPNIWSDKYVKRYNEYWRKRGQKAGAQVR